MLKQLIQRLLDSRTTPAQAANSSMPSDSSIAVQMLQTATVDWDNVANYTAPTDGFISARGMSTSANAYFQIMAGSTATNPSTSLQVSTASQWPQMVLPVAKGRKIAIYAAMMKDITVFFNSSIGGGYNILVRRVLSCLRALSNCLPRSFCKAKSLAFQNNPLLSSIKALTSLAQAPRISLPTPHRATAGRLLGAIQLQSQLLKSKSRTGRWHLLPYLTETLRELESVVTLKKGHRLSSCVVAEVQPIILFGSTRQVQTFNPLTGGALC